MAHACGYEWLSPCRKGATLRQWESWRQVVQRIVDLQATFLDDWGWLPVDFAALIKLRWNPTNSRCRFNSFATRQFNGWSQLVRDLEWISSISPNISWLWRLAGQRSWDKEQSKEWHSTASDRRRKRVLGFQLGGNGLVWRTSQPELYQKLYRSGRSNLHRVRLGGHFYPIRNE